MGVQGGNGLFRRLDLRRGDAQGLGDGAVVLPAQLRQEPGGDIHGVGDGFFLAAQLQYQTFRQVPGAYAGRLQGLDNVQSLIHHGLGNFHLRQAVQVLLGQIAVLVHHLRHVFCQGQQRLGQPLPLQLVGQESGETVQLLVQGSWLHGRALLMGEGGAEVPGIQPAGLLPQFRVGGLEVRGVAEFQGGVFLRQLSQVVQKLLGVHLQNFHGLQQLGRQLQLLPQFCF